MNGTFVRMQLNDILFMGTFQNIFVILLSAYNLLKSRHTCKKFSSNHVNMCKGIINCILASCDHLQVVHDMADTF